MPRNNPAPPGRLLPIGRTFQTILGPRRAIYVGETSYFHKENRRYLCRIVDVRQLHARPSSPPYQGYRGYTLTVEVIEHA